jgi:tRNA(fMet)-specific endonuclease VapC
VSSFLFDSIAIVEALLCEPGSDYAEWLTTVPREEQFASAVSVAELFRGADGSESRVRHLTLIEERILPAVTVLPFDVAVAKVYGELRAAIEAGRQGPSDAELQVAATALYHGLELVTEEANRFRRVPGLRLRTVPTG